MQTPTTGHYSTDLRQLVQELYAHCKTYSSANNGKAAWQLASTAIPFFALVTILFWFATDHYWLVLPLVIPAGALLTRFFALQHDCGHSSFFSDRRANEWTGEVISLLTFTPYDHWRKSHAMHHAGSGNLERRGIGDVETLTVQEFQSLSRFGKLRYRISRNPIVALVIGPPVYFLILQRLAIGSTLSKRQSLPGILIHDAALVLFYGALCYFLGTFLVFSVVIPVVLVGAWIGGWLFYVQHQFEETLWEGADKWDVKIAALKGSSHLMLNPVLNWFSCDIGLHHIHHLSSRIPNYRLRECLVAHKDLKDVAPKLTVWSAMKSARLALWDEANRKLISFRDYHRQTLATQ